MTPAHNDNARPLSGRDLDSAVRHWTEAEILERLGKPALDDDHDVPPGDAA